MTACEMMEALGLPANEEAARKLTEYNAMVIAMSKKVNLTGIKDVDESLIKNVYDSLTVYDPKYFPAKGRVLDLGTGAGFPGVPLASARKLIGERGFDRVSVEDITRDSGVAKGTFYHYFKCKEDVVAELSFQSSQTILEESVHFDGTADERCFHYVTALCRDADWAGVRLVRQWIREAMESEEEDSEAKACLYDIYNAIVKICAVRQGRGPGELREDAPLDTLAKLLMSHVFGALTIWCMMNGSWNLSEQSVKYMEIDIKNLFEPYMTKE